MPTPNVLGIIQQGIDRGELDPQADIATRRDYVNAYAIEHARDEDEYKRFVTAAEPAFQQMHLDEVDPTGELRRQGAKAAAERAAGTHPILQPVSDVAAGMASSGARIAGGIAGIFSPSAGQYMRNVAEQAEIATDTQRGGFAKQAGEFVPYVAGGVGAGTVGALTAMFGAGAGTAQEQGASPLASAGYGAVNAGVGYATGLGVGKVAGKYLTQPLANGVGSLVGAEGKPILAATINRIGQGVAGDIGFGVGAPVGQAAADTLQIGGQQGLEDLKEIPAALAANLALGPLAHSLTARAQGIADVEARHQAEAKAANEEIAAHIQRMAEQQPVNTDAFREEAQSLFYGPSVRGRSTAEDLAQAGNEAPYGTDPRTLFQAPRAIEIKVPEGTAMLRPVAADRISSANIRQPEGPAIVGSGRPELINRTDIRTPEGPAIVGSGRPELINRTDIRTPEEAAILGANPQAEAAREAARTIRQPEGPAIVGSGRPELINRTDIRTPEDVALAGAENFAEADKARIMQQANIRMPGEKPGRPKFSRLPTDRSPLGSHVTPEGKPVVDARMPENVKAPLAAGEMAERRALDAGKSFPEAHKDMVAAQNAEAAREGQDPAKVEGAIDAALRDVIYKEPQASTAIDARQAEPSVPTMPASAGKIAAEAAGVPNAEGLRSDQVNVPSEGQKPGVREEARGHDRAEQPREAGQANDQVGQGKVALAVKRPGLKPAQMVKVEHLPGEENTVVIHNDEGKSTIGQYVTGRGNKAKPITVSEAAKDKTARVRPISVDNMGEAKLVGEAKDVQWHPPEVARALANMRSGESLIGARAKRETAADAGVAKEAAAYNPEEAAKAVEARYEAANPDPGRMTEEHFAKEKPVDLQAFLSHADKSILDTPSKYGTLREIVTEARDKGLNRPTEQFAAGSVGEESSGHRVAPELVSTLSRLVGRNAEIWSLSDNHVRIRTPNGHTIDVIRDVIGQLPKGTLGSVRTIVQGKATRSLIRLHPDASPGTLAHEVGHIKLDHFLTDSERKLLLSRVTDAQVKKTLAKYEAAGVPVSEAKAREEAALDRLRDYENHGVLERSIWQRVMDFAKELAKHFGLGEGSEKQIMDQMLGGEFFKRTAHEAKSKISYSLPSEPETIGEKKRGWRQRLATAIRENPFEEPALRLEAIAERKTGQERDAILEAAEAMRTADKLARQRLLAGHDFVREASKIGAETKHKDMRAMITSDAPISQEGGVSSPLYSALYEGKKPEDPTTAKTVKVVEGATKLTNQQYREGGIAASGRTPHANGRDFWRVLRDTDLREALFRVMAKTNRYSVEEMRKDFADTNPNQSDSAVQLARAEVGRKYDMPQYLDVKGQRYELFTVEPERLVRGIIEDAAHRSAFTQVFGAGKDIRFDDADMKGLKLWKFLSGPEKEQVLGWSKMLHGISTGYRPDLNSSRNWVRTAADVADAALALEKAKTLTTAVPGNIVGSLGTITQAGVVPTVKAMTAVLTSPHKEIIEAQKVALASQIARSVYDPNNSFSTFLRGAGQKIDLANRVANAASDTVAKVAANFAFDAAQEATRKGKPDRDYQIMLRSIGLSAKDIKAITEDGSATPQLRDEAVRRTVSASTGSQSVRGEVPAWENSWALKKFGPGFTSWANAQIRRRARIAALIVEGGHGTSPYKLLASDIAVALGVGAITTSFWAATQGGKEGVTQQWDRDAASQIGDYLWQGYGGGYINTMGSLYTKFNNTPASDVLKSVSFPASAVMNEAHALVEAAHAMRNGEGMVAALTDYGVASTPLLQRTRDALAWSVEDRNPGTLRKALTLFNDWRKNNPTLATPPFSGGASAESDTTLAINRAIRAIKQGDDLSLDLAMKIGLVAAQEAKDPSKVRSAILGHRIITKLPVATRQQALDKIYQDLGPVTVARLQRHDLLLEIMAQAAAPQ